MKAEIITIGDELLIGQVVDTNSAWLGQQLTLNGIKLVRKSAVSDAAAEIVAALKESSQRADVILMTGGLGPTKDDITKKTLCDHFGMGMRLDEEVLKDIEDLFRRFGKEMTPTNRTQAEVPDGCKVIRNQNGTAPGMWFEKDGKIFVSMPGVPYEMKSMFAEQVIPALRERYELPVIFHQTVMTQGIGESWLSDTLEGWEASLAAEGITLAYLPAPGIVRLRLTAQGDNEEQVKTRIRSKIDELFPIIGKYIFATEDIPIQEAVGRVLKSHGLTLSTAESCTGGFMAHLLTSVPGSSDYYFGSTVTYANEAKSELLEVPAGMIAQFGAVSEPVVKAMAEGARKRFNSDYALSTSGIAGPTGGTPDKPVGTVWVGMAGPHGVTAKCFQFGDNRERNIIRASQAALMMLYRDIEKTGS